MKITQPVYQRGLGIKKESHLLSKVGAAKLDLKKNKHVAFLCSSTVDLICLEDVWQAPSGISAGHLSLKSSLQQELTPHRGDGANSSSLHTYPFILFCSCLLLLLLFLLTLLFFPSLCSIPKVQHRAVMLSVTETVVGKSLVRAEERLCLSV